MPADLSVREGKLQESLDQLEQAIRVNPSSVKERVFLFQLLAVMGQWDRALNQLGVIAELDTGAMAMVQTYREALRCEALRSEVFAGRRAPLILGEPEQWLAMQIEALRLLAERQNAASGGLRKKAFDAAPATSGTIDGQDFEWIADGDARLGPVLEAIVNGRYYWIPFHRIRVIRIDTPADLRDVVWMPAQFAWANGGEAVGLIPTRYAGSEASQDSRIQMARRTEWREVDDEASVGLGQRTFATDAGEHALMDTRLIQLNAPTEGNGRE